MQGAKNFLNTNKLWIWAYPENLVQIRLLVLKLVKGGRCRGLWGAFWGMGGLE